MRWGLIAGMLAASLAFSFAASADPGAVRKPVVSINDIQDMANTGQGAQLRQMIETTIVNTGKFRIMERGDQGMGVMVGEQQRAKAGLVTSNTPGKIGGFEGVDFMVYGTITTGDSKANCITLKFPGGVLTPSMVSAVTSVTGVTYNCLEMFANPMPTWSDWI